jgi:glycosyltransferase involved in cell wall biosynthesis
MFVLSSDFEGIPNALLESMSIGVPSVSTDCSPGGAAMLIRNKENGLLVPKGDVKALATAMEFIITHPAESERMAIQATEVNELYAETEIAGKWESFLTKLK